MKNTKVCGLCGAKVKIKFDVCPECGDHFNTSSTSSDKSSSSLSIKPADNNSKKGYIVPKSMKNNYIKADSKDHQIPKNKWVAFGLCLLFGAWGAHKFYEGKFGLGIVYALTWGLFGIGIIVDLISIISKPETYYVDNNIQAKKKS